MATGTQEVESTFLERLGDKFTSLSEGFVGFLTRMMGSANENTIRKLGYIRSKDKKSYSITPGSLLARVDELEPTMEAKNPDGAESADAHIFANGSKTARHSKTYFLKRSPPAA